jgi:hypothetical protein
MKTLYVCGDSFVTPSSVVPNTHFTEILAKKFGYDLKVLSHGGMSNNGICLQVEYAIKNNASFVIISPTYYDRFDLPIIDKKTPYDVNDLFYPGDTYASFVDDINRSLISGALLNYEDWHVNSLIRRIKGIKEKSHQLKEYFSKLYNPVWKQQQDIWALYATLHKLHVSAIPYLIVLSKYDLLSEFNWLNETNYTLPLNEIIDRVTLFKKSNMPDHGYHTSSKDQIYIAERLLMHMEKVNHISSFL